MRPVVTQIGPVTIFTLGLLLGLGFLFFTFLVYREIKKAYLDEEQVFDVIFLSTIAAIIGARTFYIIEHFDSFGFNFLNWILVNAKPGFSIWGGVGSALAVFLITVKNRKLPQYQLLDIFVIPFATLLTIGYFGAFLGGVDIGKPTTLPWGVVTFSTLKRHPIGLYQSLTSLLVLIAMIKLKKILEIRKSSAGVLFSIYIMIESFILFLIAFMKEDDIVIGRAVSDEQLIYLIVFLASCALLYIRLGRNLKTDLNLLRYRLINIKKKEKTNENISK